MLGTASGGQGRSAVVWIKLVSHVPSCHVMLVVTAWEHQTGLIIITLRVSWWSVIRTGAVLRCKFRLSLRRNSMLTFGRALSSMIFFGKINQVLRAATQWRLYIFATELPVAFCNMLMMFNPWWVFALIYKSYQKTGFSIEFFPSLTYSTSTLFQ